VIHIDSGGVRSVLGTLGDPDKVRPQPQYSLTTDLTVKI